MAKHNNIKELFVSVVVVAADKKTDNLHVVVTEISTLLKSNYTNYEIIVVDNLLNEDSLSEIVELLAVTPCIRIVRLSKPDSKDVCVFVGIEASIGDITVVLSGDQDSPSLITGIVEEACKVDIVYGVSTVRIRKGFINNYGAKLFYWYNKKFLNINIPENSTYLMAFNRKAVNALTRSRRHARHIRYLARQIGYKSSEFQYQPIEGYEDRKKISSLFVSALELSTNYSKHPLRFLSWVGFAAAFMNLVYAGYVIIVNVLKKEVEAGWTTLSLQASVMFFLLFAILAVLVEYVGRILDETSGDSPYNIIDELNSTVSVADATRRNIAK